MWRLSLRLPTGKCKCHEKQKKNMSWSTRDVVVVDDLRIQRIVLATEDTTVTQVSHRPIKCQSRAW